MIGSGLQKFEQYFIFVLGVTVHSKSKCTNSSCACSANPKLIETIPDNTSNRKKLDPLDVRRITLFVVFSSYSDLL